MAARIRIDRATLGQEGLKSKTNLQTIDSHPPMGPRPNR